MPVVTRDFLSAMYTNLKAVYLNSFEAAANA